MLTYFACLAVDIFRIQSCISRDKYCVYVQDREDHPVGDAFRSRCGCKHVCQLVISEMHHEGTLKLYPTYHGTVHHVHPLR